ncbi:MAG: hypothetical protein WCK90_01560 [archaeon]
MRTKTFVGVVRWPGKNPAHHYCTVRPNAEKACPWLSIEPIADLMYIRHGAEYADRVTFDVPHEKGLGRLSRLNKIEEEHFYSLMAQRLEGN